MIDVKTYLRKPYTRVVTPDESGLFTGQILEFPGCFAEGGSPAEAYANLDRAAESWLLSADANGMAVPEPSASAGHSGTVSLRLPKSMHRRAAQMASRDRVSLNQFLVDCVAERLGAQTLYERFTRELRQASAQTPNNQTIRAFPFEGDRQLVAGLATAALTFYVRAAEQTASTRQRVPERLALPEAR
jgi:predicted RNase H-like HicB family nuclease